MARHQGIYSASVYPPSLRDDSNSNLEFGFRTHHRNLQELFNARNHSPMDLPVPLVSWANMRTMEDRVLIHVNSFLGKSRDRLQSRRGRRAIPALSAILSACSRYIELLLEVQ